MGYLVKNDCCISLYPAGDKLFTQKCDGLFLIDLKNGQQSALSFFATVKPQYP